MSAKKSPCPSRNKGELDDDGMDGVDVAYLGEVCAWGDDCCYGHSCPLMMKCHFLKQGRCKFVGGKLENGKGTEH